MPKKIRTCPLCGIIHEAWQNKCRSCRWELRKKKFNNRCKVCDKLIHPESIHCTDCTPPRDQSGENNPAWKGGQSIHTKGYRLIYMPDHPRAHSNNGYIFEHILVMEKHLGRHLVWKGDGHPESEIVHHINEDKTDNRIENLQLTTHAEHTRLHNLGGALVAP